jgi:hypothetical protein
MDTRVALRKWSDLWIPGPVDESQTVLPKALCASRETRVQSSLTKVKLPRRKGYSMKIK